MPIYKRHLILLTLFIGFIYFLMPVSAFSIDPINTIAINGTATDMTLNGTHFWVSDDQGFLYEFDIDFVPTAQVCSINTTANNYATFLYYDQLLINETATYGLFDPDFNGWTLPIEFFVYNAPGPPVPCSTNQTGTWLSTRVYGADSWHYNSTDDVNVGQWNQPLVSSCQYLHVWMVRDPFGFFRTESGPYPACIASDPGVTMVAASTFASAIPTPVDVFVIGNNSGVGGQDIHKYNSISFTPIGFNIQYIIDTDVDYPDIDRIMAAEFLQNGTDKWLYLINNTHAWRIDIDEFEAGINQTVLLLSPLNLDVLSISEVTAKYRITIIDNVTIKIFLDGSLFNEVNRSDFESGNYFEAFGNLSSDVHTWGVRLSNQSNDFEFDFPNATFTIQISAIEEVAEGVRSALGLPDIATGLTIMAFMIIIAVSIGAAGFMFAMGGSGEGVGVGFVVTFIGSTLVLGSVGWLPTWISIMIIIMGGFIVGVFMLKGLGGLRGG